MNMGQMVKDVKIAINGNAEVVHLGRPAGEWLDVDEILDFTKKMMGDNYATSI